MCLLLFFTVSGIKHGVVSFAFLTATQIPHRANEKRAKTDGFSCNLNRGAHRKFGAVASTDIVWLQRAHHAASNQVFNNMPAHALVEPQPLTA
jgi:hypothetical protein